MAWSNDPNSPYGVYNYSLCWCDLPRPFPADVPLNITFSYRLYSDKFDRNGTYVGSISVPAQPTPPVDPTFVIVVASLVAGGVIIVSIAAWVHHRHKLDPFPIF